MVEYGREFSSDSWLREHFFGGRSPVAAIRRWKTIPSKRKTKSLNCFFGKNERSLFGWCFEYTQPGFFFPSDSTRRRPWQRKHATATPFTCSETTQPTSRLQSVSTGVLNCEHCAARKQSGRASFSSFIFRPKRISVCCSFSCFVCLKKKKNKPKTTESSLLLLIPKKEGRCAKWVRS